MLTMNSQAGGGPGHPWEPMRGSYWGFPGTRATTCWWSLAHILPAWWKPSFAGAQAKPPLLSGRWQTLCQGSSGIPSHCLLPGMEPYLCQQTENLLPPSHFLSWLMSLMPSRGVSQGHQCPSPNFPRQRGFPQDHPWNTMKLSSPDKWMHEWINY